MSKRIKTIVIDAGHGGRDPGAIGKSAKEKDITLSIALKLGNLLNQKFPEVDVIYTRREDKFVELFQRAEIANKAKADLFISIHVNSTSRKDVNGVEFWVLGLHKADDNLEVVKKENAALNFEQDINKNYGFDPNSPEGNIMMTMKQSLHLEKSIQLAKTIENKFTVDENQVVRGTKQAGFIVLYKTNMPSVLVEVGFVSNMDEEQFISNEYGQQKIASKLASAVSDYKRNFESGKLPSVDLKEETKPSSTSSSNTESVSTQPKRAVSINDPVEPKPNTYGSPSASVLEKSKSKNRIVIDDEMDMASSAEPTISMRKTTETPPSNPPSTSVTSKPTISVEKPNKMDVKSDISLKKTLKKDTIISKKIATKAPNEPVKTYTKEVVKESGNVPTYVKDKEIKQEIIDNTKELDRKVKTAEKSSTTAVKSDDEPKEPKKTISSDGKLVFRVQVKASASKVNTNDKIFSLGEQIDERFEGEMYKYLAGSFASESAARNLQQTLKDKGISDCFIVKYLNGVRTK